VLVFGAGTNYALLLVARYRDELRRREDRFAAMDRACARPRPAILASGGTVALSLLTLLFADLTSNRGLGFGGAVGVVVAMAVGLVVLPAALVLPGRWLFWPFVPRVGDPTTAERAGVWSRLGRLVARRPAVVAAGSLALLGALSLGALGASTGLALADSFREPPEAVQGQRTLERSLPAGAAAPLTVVSAPDGVDAVVAAAEGVDGVVEVRPAPVTGDLAVTSVVLDAAAGTDRSDEALVALRERLAEVPEADAAVGGETAEAYDVARATARDTRVVVPLVLVLVFLVLAVLLRALLAPLLLVLSTGGVVLLRPGRGLAGVRPGLRLPGARPGRAAAELPVPRGARCRLQRLPRRPHPEDVLDGHPTRDAVVRALAATGGVITSAGIVLAAVFAVLGVLPIIVLTQIGVIVGDRRPAGHAGRAHRAGALARDGGGRAVLVAEPAGPSYLRAARRCRRDARAVDPPLGGLDRDVVDRGLPARHVPVRVELPELVAVAAPPLAVDVVPLVLEAHRDAVVGEGPERLAQRVVLLPLPLAAQERDDLVAAVQELRAVAPAGVRRVRGGDALGVAGVPGVLRGLHLLARGRLVERRDGWSHEGSSGSGPPAQGTTRVRAPVPAAISAKASSMPSSPTVPLMSAPRSRRPAAAWSSTFGMSVSGSVEP
jgi:hypothetical protein